MKSILKDGKINIAIAVLIGLGIAGLMVILFVEAPKPDPKVIKNMTIEQKGLNIEVRWDPVDCKGYRIKVKKGLFDTQTRNIESSGFRIRRIEPERTYDIEVMAIMKNGEESVATFGTIDTQKLKQEITAEVEKVDGFAKDKISVGADGKGDISYKSNNEKIATVSEEGKVTLKKQGRTTIVIKASGNDIYKQGKKKLKVRVFPQNLPKVKGVKAENVSDTRALISWEAADFATEYHLMKKNAATKKYEDIKSVGENETSVEITRDDGKYAIKAVAKVGDRQAGSDVSEPVEIRGTTKEAESYSSGKNIMKLDGKTLNLVRIINGDGGTNIPQSLSLTDDCYVVSYVNQSGTSGKMISYRKTDGECVDITSCSGMGHANGTTYDRNKNRFYVVKTHKSIRTASCSTYDGTTKKSTGTFNLPRVTSGIAYDVSNNKYYLSKGNEIYVCDSNFKVEKFIHKFVRYNHAQDIGAYNGVVLVCTWVSGNTSYIDMYRISDGAYLGSYDVSIGEIESCVVDDGYLVILMNTRGSSRDRIYKTKERIAIP